jgi:3-oxoacyl-[acyl-carrier-protein] synthase III
MTGTAFINRLALVLPNAPVDNGHIEDILGQAGGRPSRSRRIVLRSNGIKSRHYVIDPASGQPNCNNAQLTAAAVQALGGAEFTLGQLELLCCGTSTPDQLLPSHAVMVHGLLGTGPLEAFATAGICMSGLAALKYGYLAVRSGETRHAVATGSEVASTFLKARTCGPETHGKVAALTERPEIAFDEEFLRWMLSDGAGAALLEPTPGGSGPSLRIDWIESLSYAHALETCMYAGAEKGPDGQLIGWREVADLEAGVRRSLFAIHQDVRLLNEHITRIAIEQGLSEVIRRRDLSPGQVDWFLPHMSSEFFREPIMVSLGRIGFSIPAERWYTNLSEVGNIGSAALYGLLFGLCNTGRLSRGERLLLMVPESGRFSVGYAHLTVV